MLGNIEDAVQYFNKCLGSAADVCLDRRVTVDAADGLQKAQVCTILWSVCQYCHYCHYYNLRKFCHLSAAFQKYTNPADFLNFVIKPRLKAFTLCDPWAILSNN